MQKISKEIVEELRRAVPLLENAGLSSAANVIRNRLQRYELTLDKLDAPVLDLDMPMRGQLVCSVRAKLVKSSVHLLDRDGDVSLTNAVSLDFCRAVLQRLGVYQPPAFYTWVCYGTDAVPAIYNFAGFVHPSPALLDSAMAAEMLRLYGPAVTR